jgi:hypothetical protein
MASQSNRPRPVAWGYPQAVALVAGLFGVGLFAGLAGSGVPAPPRLPASAFLLGALFLGTGVLQRLSSGAGFVQWLGSVKVSVASTAWLAVLTLVVGLVPQDGRGWYRQVVSSWPFAFAILLLLVNLGLAIWRRSRSLSMRNLGWLAGHAGMWLVAGAMAAGSSDIVRLRIVGEKGRAVETAFLPGDEEMTAPIPLPFALILEEFVLDRYPPRLVISAHPSGKTMHTETLAEGMEGGWKGWKWKALRFIPSARPRGEGFEPDPAGKGEFAALLGFSRDDGAKAAGWLAPERRGKPRRIVLLEGGWIAGSEAAPRLYRSTVTLAMKDGERVRGTVEVNRPFSFRGWRFYQASYDTAAGPRSRVSVIEAVRDPWLPVVWCGVGLLFAGMAYLFIAGLRPRGGA